MSRIINPLLLDKPANAAPVSRNFARPSAKTAEGTSFAQEMAAMQKPTAPTTAAPASQGGITGPLATINNADPEVQASNAAPEVKSASANVEAATEEAEIVEREPVKVASSWRVDRSAAEVYQEDEDFTFGDFVDIINPLHHIPVVGTIYRELTDEKIKPVSRVVGDVLYGAITGSVLVSCIASAISAAYEQNEGAEPLTQLASAIFGADEADAEAPVMLAQADAKQDKGEFKLASAVVPEAPVPQASTAIETVSKASLETAFEPAAATEDKIVTKQPFGGVMDMGGAARNQPMAKVATASGSQGIKIGNTIYTNPTMNPAAKAQAMQAARLEAKAVKTPAAVAATAIQPSTEEAKVLASVKSPAAMMSVPGSDSADDKQKLGQLMHQSAGASSTGNTLPPDLVRDMMLMALDKYKTAGNLAPSEMTLGAVN